MNKLIRIGTMIKAEKALQVLPELVDHGFESFSLNFGPSVEGLDLKEFSKKIAEIIADRDIVISTVSIYGNPLTGKGKSGETVAGWEQLIDNAYLFGADMVTGFTGRIVNKPIPDSIPEFKKVFSKLAKRAKDNNVRIGFENCSMNGDWWSGDWNIAHNPTAWEMMFDAVPEDNLGLEWEPCHQMVALIDSIAQLRKWAKKVFHVHGKDATVGMDIVKEYGIHGPNEFAWHRTPGFGDTNWHDIITILMQNNYNGTIDIEGYHDPVFREELELVGQLKALKYLKDCRGGEKFVKSPF